MIFINIMESYLFIVMVNCYCCWCLVSKYVWLFETPWIAACQTSLSLTISLSLPKFMSIELVMSSNHLILCHHILLLLSIVSSIRVFSSELAQVAQVLELQCQSFQWVLRVRLLYDWLVWSSLCPRDSQESSPVPQFKSINSSVLSLLYGPTLTWVHDCWKDHSFDYMDLCWQSDVSAF